MMNWRSYGLLLLTSLIWGISNVPQKNVLQFIGPLTAVGLRCLLASIVVLPFAWKAKQNFSQIRSSGKFLAFATALSFALALTLTQIGIGHTSVINTSFFINTWTVMTPICVWVLKGVRPARFLIPAAALSLAGTFLMAGGTLDAMTIGDVLCLLAAFVYSVWAICLNEFVRRFDGALFISLFQFAVAGGLCLAIGFIYEPFNLQNIYNAAPDLLILGVFSTGLGYVLQAIAQAKVTSSVSAVILSMEAIFGAIGGILFLDESFTTLSFFGAAMIFGGVILVQLTCGAEQVLKPKPDIYPSRPQAI